MEKLILQTDDLKATKSLVETLHGLQIQDDSITVVANENTPLDDLPHADLEGSDVVPAYKRGLAIGGTAGLLAGLAAFAFPPAGIVIGGGAVLTGALGGASFGAFAAALIGVNVPNSQLEEYEDAIKAGKLLVVVEVEEGRLEEIVSKVESSHPEVQNKGTIDFVPPAV